MGKIQKVTIEQVYISDKNKDGEPFRTRDGKPFSKVGIKVNGEWWTTLSFSEQDKVRQLKDGEEANVLLEENGQYKNFKLPTRLDKLELRVEALEYKLARDATEKKLDIDKTQEGVDEGFDPDDEVNLNDTPF